MTGQENTINTCIQMLQHIMEDNTIPRNIRRVADETRSVLMDESKTIGLRAATAISMIDEVSNDPNMPVHARTRIWELVSQLESVPLD
ncbi:UPF0147 family protein [Methanosphaerula palustris]|jgi:uncharacterized protein (UPF0147 family)|uniref:UPF0147 protein Mpal_1058 n=1 Tax=Methanosphaerula palustris (strain ATCC BAA-1556 / DSM 19958 / E1-9c) TaxID=521011 RepID=B8GH00_METPE|nr:UPF0147 family protein [Methanosphaerula palustris]ACL16405.1 Protein of unknown function UPF0147 [Methanosphaerula palustris E1-9c]